MSAARSRVDVVGLAGAWAARATPAPSRSTAARTFTPMDEHILSERRDRPSGVSNSDVCTLGRLSGGGEEERVLHRDLVRRLEGEDPAPHQALDARGHLGASERALLDADVPGAPSGRDVEPHHHLALEPGVPLQLALVAAADGPQPVAD